MSNYNVDWSSVGTAGMGPPPEEGCYKVKVTSIDLKETARGGVRARSSNSILEGRYAGRVIYDGILIPEDKATFDKVAPFWKALFESIGINPAKLPNEVSKKVFVALHKKTRNRTGYINFKPAPEGSWPKITWVSQAAYDAWTESNTDNVSKDEASDTDNSGNGINAQVSDDLDLLGAALNL